MIGCLGTNAIWNTFVIEVYYSYIRSSVQIIWINMPSGENARDVTSSNNFFLMVFAVIFLGADNKTDMRINMIMYWYLEIHMCDISYFAKWRLQQPILLNRSLQHLTGHEISKERG